ncbi:hypothetical protein SAY87_001986 [Trapa incisa]|uniref:GH18 domain-containing protein n=1 Tax=Trapa incisa TaxID=236973 RepID=A0AAN7JW13_9MYRT|nr:hypothetical protein SAY87_001986 [Trapa incisa]
MSTLTRSSSTFLVLAIFMSFVSAERSAASPLPVKGAYYPSWFNHTFPASAIDTSLFTHIFYTFLSPSNEIYRFEVSASTAALLSNFTSSLSRKTPRVKTLISIGGGEAGPSLYAQMASSAATREALIDSSIWVARRIGFDGLDLDWEFPENPAQTDDFSKLLAES